MSEEQPSYWFKRKRYGWGWTPVTIQAVVTLLAYSCVVGLDILILDKAESQNFGMQLSLFFLVLFTATTTLYWIASTKGPKPRWRWGKKPGDNKNEDF